MPQMWKQLATAVLVTVVIIIRVVVVSNWCCPASYAGADQIVSSASIQSGTPISEQPKPISPIIDSSHQGYLLQDEAGHSVKPISVVLVENNLYFLGSGCLWLCQGVKAVVGGEDILVLKRFDPPKMVSPDPPWQEFNDFVYYPAQKSLVVLDKSGDVFQFSPTAQTWSVFHINMPTCGAPDPDYMALCAAFDGIELLDPERNQIWTACGPKKRLQPYFKEVLPWRLKPGDSSVCDAIAIGFAESTYVLRKDGRITKYNGNRQQWVHYNQPHNIRPSRLIVDGNRFLYMVERENNRVLRVDTIGGAYICFTFPKYADLRGMLPTPDGFWIVNGDQLMYRSFRTATPKIAQTSPHQIDARLLSIRWPIKGQNLPRHPGVYPGARRLYRYGVHEGLDLFNSSGTGTIIKIGTPVLAAHDGTIIRADLKFKDMNWVCFNRIMNECRLEHRTSSTNEDLFRGCQVWIDHGDGLVTRYAHLSRVNPELKINSQVKQGDLIGYVGVSGTGENLPGRVPYPHLHFEILLDNKYLGWGLTPAETIGVFEDIFAKPKNNEWSRIRK